MYVHKFIKFLFITQEFHNCLYNKNKYTFFILKAHHSDSVDLPVVQYVEVNQ